MGPMRMPPRIALIWLSLGVLLCVAIAVVLYAILHGPLPG